MIGRGERLCALSQGSQGRAEDTDEKGRGRQEAAPGGCQEIAVSHSWPGSWSRPLGQLEALSRVRPLRVRSSRQFKVVRGHFISLNVCPQLSNRKVPPFTASLG